MATRPRADKPRRRQTGASPGEPTKSTANAAPRVQAVVLVHGMGEQRPMGTLRGFVDAVWGEDLSLTWNNEGKRTTDPVTGRSVNRSWIVPDRRTASHELRRITTVADKKDRRTDFYELYWADLLQENALSHFYTWMRSLLFRRPSTIPADAWRLYVVLWIMTILAAAPAVVLWIMAVTGSDRLILPATLWTALAAIVGYVIANWILPTFGDVATYVRAEASTVAKRQMVRERGLALLATLTNDDSYDRIIVVGHSLGSIIAYDLLQILWSDNGPNHRNPRADSDVTARLRAFDEFATPPGGTWFLPEERLPAFRDAQWALYRALRDAPSGCRPWKVSDFVTIGSPLSHAEFLLEPDVRHWRQGVEERLYSICPPISDDDEKRTIIYNNVHAHHAAVFAATRWTNIFDAGNGWSTGDPFSGPMHENFGGGVVDRQVRLSRLRWGRLITHSHYWALDPQQPGPGGEPKTAAPHLQVLREAVDLIRKAEDPAA